MESFNLEVFAQRIRDMHQRVSRLNELAETALTIQQQQELTVCAFEELAGAKEELEIANEYLFRQNQALAAERQRYRELFERAPDGYLVTDIKGTIREANRAAATLLNIPQQFLVGKPLSLYIAPSERSIFCRQINRLSQIEEKREWDMHLQPRQQATTPVAVTMTAIQESEGTIVGWRWLLRDIRDRKQTEMALRESQALLQTVVSNAPIVLYALDRDGIFTLSEGEGLKSTGLQPGEVVGQSIFDLRRNHPNIPDNIRLVLAGEKRTWIARVNDRIYENRATPVRDETGQVTGVIGVATDITEQQQAREELQQFNGELEARVRERTAELEQANTRLRSEIDQHQQTFQALQESQAALSKREQEFKALVEHAPDVIERYDRNLRHVYVNPAIERATGKPPAEFIGKTNRELEMPDAKTLLWEKALQTVFQTAQEEQIEFSCPSPSGQRYYQTRLVPEFATNGTVADESGSVETILGISRDISQRKQTEEALRESAERFRQLAENIREVFWLVSPDRTQLLYVSPAYEEIWGRTCQSLYEQPLSWLDAIHPEDRDRCFATLNELKDREWEMEYRILRGDGLVRWIRDRSFAIRDEGGCVYRIAGIAEDITERKQAAEEVMKALEAERELNQLKSSFVAMTSHEFRTPLTAIQASAEMLERYQQRLSEEKQRNHFHRIGAAVERMTDMLNDVLILSQAEAGKLEFQPAPLDLGQFCRSLVEDFRANAKNQPEIVLTEREIAPPKSPPQIDEKLLRHILSNLLSNAFKYSPAESTVEFELICDRDRAIFRIQDRGIGIPPQDLSHLFESFRRATNVGNIQGTGLGLAIVKRCVDLHGGEIQVESEVGCGTTFTVTLPLNYSLDNKIID